jgi:hypothetical protein
MASSCVGIIFDRTFLGPFRLRQIPGGFIALNEAVNSRFKLANCCSILRGIRLHFEKGVRSIAGQFVFEIFRGAANTGDFECPF